MPTWSWATSPPKPALRQLVDGADAVVHAAGLIKARTDRDFLPVNRDSAALLSALAPDAHLVLLSSLAAREPQLSAYGASKRAGEAVVATRSGPWTVVRAPAVYGPGDRETLAYFRAVKSGFAPQPRLPAARLSLIHVADLAEALALTVERPPPNATYEIDDGRAYTYADMAGAAGEALGRRPWRIAVPRGVHGLSRGMERAAAGPGRRRPDPDPGEGERDLPPRLVGPGSAAGCSDWLPASL